jgi:hypothetical protein
MHSNLEQRKPRFIPTCQYPLLVPVKKPLHTYCRMDGLAYGPAIALLVRHRRVSPATFKAAAVATGLLVPGFLIVTAISIAYRYRMEFYPEIDFLAFLGLYLTVSNRANLERFARFRIEKPRCLRHERKCTLKLTASPCFGAKPAGKLPIHRKELQCRWKVFPLEYAEWGSLAGGPASFHKAATCNSSIREYFLPRESFPITEIGSIAGNCEACS